MFNLLLCSKLKTMAKELLKVGDKVMWLGSWGKDTAKEAIVEDIELCKNGQKYGSPVTTVAWEGVLNRTVNITVNLDNGHWAYGYQLKPI